MLRASLDVISVPAAPVGMDDSSSEEYLSADEGLVGESAV